MSRILRVYVLPFMIPVEPVGEPIDRGRRAGSKAASGHAALYKAMGGR